MLETKRLLLREYTMDDFSDLYEIMSDPETMQHYPSPFDKEKTLNWITWNLDNYARYGFGLWAVTLKDTGIFIGDCGITIQNIDGEMLPEIGYHINKKYWKQGYAKEAAQACRDWVFENTDYDAIYSYMKYTNVSSCSTALAIGMTKTKEFPDPQNGVSYAYAITRHEWENLNLLFYKEYEQFYKMAHHSKAFQAFCRDAFGEDFSQDGFSDIQQINRILRYIPSHDDVHILDVGCGNGKMLGYLQKKTGAHIYGFDYSYNAISTAQKYFGSKGSFIQGRIGEVEYDQEMFDVITSIDTMYFAPDISAFTKQLFRWLKKDGVLFICYQEGDIMPKTQDAYSTVLAKALTENGISFEVSDISEESYKLLLKKRAAALAHEREFVEEGNEEWFHMLISQTDYANEPFDIFSGKMARYIYVIRKHLISSPL